MKYLKSISLPALLLVLNVISANAQLPTKISSGQVIINDGSLAPNEIKYKGLSDSLDKQIKRNPRDTTSLFYRALLYVKLNGLLAKPAQREKFALDNLLTAKNMIETAVSLNMTDFRLKVLRAQAYKELCYRYTGDESWKFNNKQIAESRNRFNNYKELANKYYAELENLDKRNAYDYQKLKVTYSYPL